MASLDFDALYVRHAAQARRLLLHFGVRSADLDDATQDTFATIHRLLGGFEGRSKIETWIHAICWRVAAGYRRRRRHDCDSAEVELSVEAGPLDLPAAEQLHASLGSLDDSDADLLVLHEVGEMSLSALSELTGRSRDTLRQRLDRTRRVLGRRIVQHAQPGPESPVRAGYGDAVDEQEVAHLSRHADEHEYLCPDYGFSRFGRMVFARWRGVNDARAVAICTKVLLAATAEAPDGISYFSVVEPSSSPPDEGARRLTAWGLRKLAGRLKGIASVSSTPEHRELVPQVANATGFLSRTRFAVRHFHDVESALSWLVPLTPGASLPALLDYSEDFRQRLDRISVSV